MTFSLLLSLMHGEPRAETPGSLIRGPANDFLVIRSRTDTGVSLEIDGADDWNRVTGSGVICSTWALDCRDNVDDCVWEVVTGSEMDYDERVFVGSDRDDCVGGVVTCSVIDCVLVASDGDDCVREAVSD
jgi:hypothetical protein